MSCYKLFLRGGKDVLKFGKWAVITRATDGIGKAYALKLASEGMVRCDRSSKRGKRREGFGRGRAGE